MLRVLDRLGPRFAWRASGGASDFAHCSESRQSHKAVSSSCRGRFHARSSTDYPFTSSCSPRPDRQDAVSFRCLAGSTARKGLAPFGVCAFPSARARVSSPAACKTPFGSIGVLREHLVKDAETWRRGDADFPQGCGRGAVGVGDAKGVRHRGPERAKSCQSVLNRAKSCQNVRTVPVSAGRAPRRGRRVGTGAVWRRQGGEVRVGRPGRGRGGKAGPITGAGEAVPAARSRRARPGRGGAGARTLDESRQRLMGGRIARGGMRKNQTVGFFGFQFSVFSWQNAEWRWSRGRKGRGARRRSARTRRRGSPRNIAQT